VQDFVVPVTEDFLDACSEGEALSVVVYGHSRSANGHVQPALSNGIREHGLEDEEDWADPDERLRRKAETLSLEERQRAKARSLADR